MMLTVRLGEKMVELCGTPVNPQQYCLPLTFRRPTFAPFGTRLLRLSWKSVIFLQGNKTMSEAGETLLRLSKYKWLIARLALVNDKRIISITLCSIFNYRDVKIFLKLYLMLKQSQRLHIIIINNLINRYIIEIAPFKLKK